MSEVCQYCGHSLGPYGSSTALYKRVSEEDSGKSWWCFGIRKDKSDRLSPHDEIVVGKYEKRRSTVAFNQRLSNFTGVKKKIQEAKYATLVPPFKANLKFLMVFPSTDLTSEALKRAAEKVGFEITQCSTVDSAFDEFQSKHHDLIVIDTRSLKALDYETLCRAIRGSKGSQHAPIVAVVKKSSFERDDGGILNLLECGFNRCISESSSVTNYINEIVQLKVSDMKPMAQKSTTQALYAALDRCNGLILITDESFKCQYANVQIEKFLDIRQEDIVGRNLSENVVYDQSQLSAMASSLLRGKDWVGKLNLQKKGQEIVTVDCKAASIACYGRLPTHFVLSLDVPALYQTDASTKTTLSNVDQRRISEYRKASLNKMMALPLEAPIVKIIGLLDEVRMRVPDNADLIRIINEAEDMLQHSELYSTQLRENFRLKPEEPVVADLITALLSNQTPTTRIQQSITSRRSSFESARPSKVTRDLLNELDELLETSLSWNFEIFLLEQMTKNRPLQHLGMFYCQHFNVPAALNCDEQTLNNWFIIIESHYRNQNFYHNSTHAADVMQATAGFLQRERIKIIMEPLDEAMCLLAAAAHDVDHPGKSSAFLANSNNPLAILYNDITILENHHCACMFKLTLGDERVNVFKNLDRETYKIVRNNVVDMILATEMTKHFEHLTKFVNVFCAKADEEDDTEGDFISLSTPENITLIKRMLIKCSDVSNPTRPFRLYVEWARRIAEEYFQQTDEEKVNGLPVVMPMFDRNTCSVPKSQIGFIDYIVNDMFEAWNAFIDMPDLINFLRQNYIRWKEFDEQGHRTLADIRILQTSVVLAPIPPSKPKLTAR